jgi:hypothetical protein
MSAVDTSWQAVVKRLEAAEPRFQALVLRAAQNRQTNWWVRRNYIMHRPTTHSVNLDYLRKGVPVQGQVWIGWYARRHAIELALAQMRDQQSRSFLENRNQHVFGSPGAPSVQWLLNQAKQQGLDETGQYQRALQWVLRPDLYSYRWRESGGGEFKRLRPDRKGDPQLLKGHMTYISTDDPEYPLATKANGKAWRVRVNDFPDAPLYTLIVHGAEVMDFDNFPKNWNRPEGP